MTGRRGPTGPERRGGPGGRREAPQRPGGRDVGAAGRRDPAGGAGPSEPEGLEHLRRAALSGPRTPASVVARGTLRRLDVEPLRPLVLDADDGTTWELLLPGGWAVEAEPGVRVTVSGDAVPDMGSAPVTRPVLRVRSLSRGD